MTSSRFPLRRAAAWCAASCAALAGACAVQPAPVEELGASRAAIQTATAAGASDTAPEMAMARDKLARAEAAAQRSDAAAARRLAEEAAVDAQVARARIEANKSRKAAAELDASLAALREEMNRASPPVTGIVKP